MATEVVRRTKCDGCSRVDETVIPPGSAGNGDRPEGWVFVRVRDEQETREGNFHSKKCGAAWVMKRDRSKKQAGNTKPASEAPDTEG